MARKRVAEIRKCIALANADTVALGLVAGEEDEFARDMVWLCDQLEAAWGKIEELEYELRRA